MVKIIFKTITSPTATVEPENFLIKCNCSSNSIKLYLFDTYSYQDKVITIKKIDSTTNNIQIIPDGSQTIDLESSVYLYSKNQYITIMSKRDGWSIIDVNYEEPNQYSTALWEPPTQRDLSSGGGIVPSGGYTSEEACTNLMDELVTLNPNYITKTTLGLDESGTYNIYKYVFEPAYYEKTIILTAGTHGNEYTGFYALYAFLREMCISSGSYPQLDYLKNNVRIVCIPIINPWGFTNSRRQNVNGVDLNRNTSYNWDRFNSDALDSGTATAGGTSTLTDSSKSWTANAYTKTKVNITDGTGAGQSYYILSNSTNVLTIDGEWVTQPDATSVYNIQSKYYKGTSAFSEAESTIFKSVVDSYSDATTCLDFHTIISTDSHYVTYVPRYMGSLHGTIKNIINNKYETGQRITFGTSTVPTLTNYACYTYGMFGGNPEVNNSKWKVTAERDTPNMNHAVWWFGNIIIECAKSKYKASESNLDFSSTKFFKYSGKENDIYFTNWAEEFLKSFKYSQDGLTAWFIGQQDDYIYQLTLRQPNKIRTAYYEGKKYDIGSDTGDNFPHGFIWSADELTLMVIGSSQNDIDSFTATTAGDVTTLSLTSTYSIVASGNVRDIDRNVAGTKLYVTFSNSQNILQVTMSSAMDLTTVTGEVTQAITQDATGYNGIVVYDSDNKFALSGISAEIVYDYTMTSGDITTFSYTTNSLDLTDRFDTIESIDISNNGTRFLVAGEDAKTSPLDDMQFAESYPMAVNTFTTIDNSIQNEVVHFDNETGTATSGDSTSLTDSGKSWSTNTYKRFYIHITSGTGMGQTREVASNTSTKITVTSAWDINPDATSVYSIEEFNSFWTGYHTYDIDRMSVVSLSGEVTLRSDRDIEVQILPAIYQNYNSEFGATDVTETNREWFIKTIFLNANVDTVIPVYSKMLTHTTNTGMVSSTNSKIYSTVTSATSDTLTDSTQSWVVDEWKGSKVQLLDGSDNVLETQIVASNTATVLTIEDTWSATPSATDKYKINIGSARTQDVVLKLRVCTNEPTKQGKVAVRDFKLSLTSMPTNDGNGLKVYSSDGRERASSSDVSTNGEGPSIAFPDPNAFNIDNYADGDGGEITPVE